MYADILFIRLRGVSVPRRLLELKATRQILFYKASERMGGAPHRICACVLDVV